jgi:ABC-type transporter Mla subunit MlaD
MRLAAVLVAGSLLLLAAACGGGDSGSSDTSSADEWAGDVCSAVTDWTGAISSVGTTLQEGGVTEESVNDALDQAREATDTFAEDLRDVGKPDTEAGDEAKQTLDDLADELEQGRDDIDNAVEGADNLQSLLAAVPTVTQTFTTLSGEVAQAFSSLQQLDAQGELEDAFSQADSCDELENS